MQHIVTHYELLGVPADAPTEAIRDAYRRAARVHHPDAHGSAAGAGSFEMAALNEAWRVLGDPVRRARYDTELAGPRSAAPRPVADEFEPAWSPTVASGPAPHYPWRFVMGLGAVGVAIVVIGVIVYRPSAPPAPDNILASQSCVVIEPNGDAREVDCSQDHDGVVHELVPFDAPCPDRTEPHRDRQGMGTACVRMAAVGGAP